MSGRSRSKGKRGELEARDAVREHWGALECVRSAQRAGYHSSDLADALPNAHVEVKRRKRISALRFFEQAESDKREEEMPVILMREDGDPRWVVMFRIEDSERFVKALGEVA